MQKLVLSGKTRAIGVSNFSISELKEVLPHTQEIPISCNQIEVHPWLPQTELVAFAKEKGILITCYSPFAGQKADGATLLKDPTVEKLAKKNNMDVGQLLGSWAVQRGTVPLGKSQKECESSIAHIITCLLPRRSDTLHDISARIRSNLDVKKLSSEDMAALDALEIPNGKGRTIDYTDKWLVNLFTN